MEKEQLREQKNHGTPFFPLAFYEWNGEGDTYMLLHWHDEMEIVYLEKGEFTFRYDMETYEVSSPAILFINSGTLHQIYLKEGQRESAFVFNLHMLSFQLYDEVQNRIIDPMLKGELQFPLMIKGEQKGFKEIRQLYLRCQKALRKHSLSSQLLIKSYLLEMLGYLYEKNMLLQVEKPAKQDETTKIMKEVLQYIKEQYQRKITIQELAQIAGMNPQYFCRFFKKKTGKTVTEYVNEFRLERSKGEIAMTKRKIIDIATENGFENIGYFMKRFKEYTHMTPSEYRLSYEKQRKKIEEE